MRRTLPQATGIPPVQPSASSSSAPRRSSRSCRRWGGRWLSRSRRVCVGRSMDALAHHLHAEPAIAQPSDNRLAGGGGARRRDRSHIVERRHRSPRDGTAFRSGACFGKRWLRTVPCRFRCWRFSCQEPGRSAHLRLGPGWRRALRRRNDGPPRADLLHPREVLGEGEGD